jgi:hypothetical protein
MPELNLNVLKSKKRSNKVVRPYYDIPQPLNPPSKDDSSNEFIDESSHENKATSLSGSELDSLRKEREEIQKERERLEKLKIQQELEIAKKKEEIQKSLLKYEMRDPNIPSLYPIESKENSIKFKKHNIPYEAIYKFLKETMSWNEPERRLALFILEKTNYGSIERIQIGRREIENNSLHGRYFKETRNSLINKGILKVEEGYIEDSKKIGKFYSINLSSIIS